MQRREKERFDYKIWGATGVKVPLMTSAEDQSQAELSKTAMSYEAKVSGELSGVIFQTEELLEDLQNANTLSLHALQKNVDELKELRVKIVKVSAELRAIRGSNTDKVDENAAKIETQVNEVMSTSKRMVRTLEDSIDKGEQKIVQDNRSAQQEKEAEHVARRNARRFAFEALMGESQALLNNLQKKYDLSSDDDNLSPEIVLKRKELRKTYTDDFCRLKGISDRLLEYTDVLYEGKNDSLSSHLQSIVSLEEAREKFEEKLQVDIETYDLSDQKMKLATKTTVDIGKFSGSLDKGVDFYTFKSKFAKAYSRHPQTLLVEWLVNNHLEGRAKECVGSLDELDAIWIRLKSMFGNTEQMLLHQFKKIQQMGSLKKVKSYEAKMHYVQKLVNTMQDTLDLAVEHDLTGDLHYGQHLQKVVSLLEDHTQNRWYKIIAQDKPPKPQRWERLIEVLTTELSIVQVRVAESMEEVSGAGDKGREGKDDSIRKTTGGKALSATEVCKFCEEKHHTQNIGFIKCPKFLKMSPKERTKLCIQKKYCFQCYYANELL